MNIKITYMGYNLFLDDIRTPKDVYNYTKNPVYLQDWVIVRNYIDFANILHKKGCPDLISFDHDLATDQYVPERYWNDYDASKLYQESHPSKHGTGYDCAKCLTGYCMDNDIPLPNYLVHSMNPVGKDTIQKWLESYQKMEESYKEYSYDYGIDLNRFVDIIMFRFNDLESIMGAVLFWAYVLITIIFIIL